MGSLPPIDFPGLAAYLLDRAETLVPDWLPGGYEEGGRWYCGDLSGAKGKSCNVNLKTGTWIDNGTDEKGGDLISLYAAIHNLNNGQAAVQLQKDLGLRDERVQAPARAAGTAPPMPSDARPEPPDEGAGPAKPLPSKPKADTKWQAIVPVPPHAPDPTFEHFQRGFPERTWAYWRDGVLYGYVCRFVTSEGGKVTLPHTWCADSSDGRGLQRWHWKMWEDPRPLYLAAGLLAEDPRLTPVVLVEGE
jgi:putative DNA primase/helicase